mgnify:CR=1 FL=1
MLRHYVFAQFTQGQAVIKDGHNWDMCNTFVFYFRDGVRAYLRNLK